jgi:hypothetical protein
MIYLLNLLAATVLYFFNDFCGSVIALGKFPQFCQKGFTVGIEERVAADFEAA